MEKFETPLVSVVMPAFNAGRYLVEAIESVIVQTYANWELVIAIDEGSRDDTREIAAAYAAKDKRIKCFSHSHRRMAAARNFALARARGKYVAFLDADNLFLPEKLALQAAFMEAHSDCGLCYGAIYHFYQDEPDALYQNKNELPELRADLFLQTLRTNFLNVLAVLVRKKILDDYGAFPEGWPACDEQYLWVNLAYHGARFMAVPAAVGLLRLHGKNDSLRPGHILDTASGFLKLLGIMESKFTSAEKEKYGGEISSLRRAWKLKRIIGVLLAYPLTSRFFMFCYRLRRSRAYNFVGERSEVLKKQDVR